MEHHLNKRHIQCKFLNCDENTLRNKETLRLFTREFSKELRIGKILSSHFLYNPNGITVVVILEQGEVTLKSEVQSKNVIVDIFTSCPTIDVYNGVTYLKRVFNTNTCEISEKINSDNIYKDNYGNADNINLRSLRGSLAKESLVITILGSAGGVSKSILSILNRAITDKQDPINKQIRNCKLHLIDSKQKDKYYYTKNFPNLINKIQLHKFNLNNHSRFSDFLKDTKTDIVIDVSYADTVDTLRCCDKLGVIYINTALESISVDKNVNYAGFSLQERYKVFESHRHEFKNTTSILCSGMNPGVVQWMAYELMKRREDKTPKGCYIVEEDTSFFEDESLAKKDTIYTTWFPEGFLDEAIYSYPTFMKNNQSLFIYKEVYELEFKVTLGDKVFYGCLMPHEEAITLGKMYDMETGFIYKINDHTTNMIKDNLDNVEVLWSKPMKVLEPEIAPLKGEDLVGILMVYEDKETYMYNCLSNKETYKKYKTNATYLQVASGVYGALATIILDNIPRGIYYIDQLLVKTENNYGKYLSYHLGPCVFGENKITDGDLLKRMREIIHS